MNNETNDELKLVDEIKSKKERLNSLAEILADLNIKYHQVA